MLLDQYDKIKVYPEQVILSYIQRYIGDDYEYKTNDKGHWINVPSPFYLDKRRRLGFNIDTGVVFDFKLQKAMDLEGFVVKHNKEVLNQEKFNQPKAEQLLFKIRNELRRNGWKLGQFNFIPKRIEEEGAISLPKLIDDDVPVGLNSFDKESIMRNRMGRKAIIYLQKREFTSSMIADFYLQYVDHEICPTCEGKRFINNEKCPTCKAWGKYKYHGRIFIPTYEEGKLVYFQARDYIGRDKKWKYLNPRAPRKQVVYFYDRLPEGERLFVAEGPFDAMFLNRYPATALMGNKVGKPFAQKLLWKKPKQLIFIPDFDSDLETRKQIFKNLTYNMKKFKEECSYGIDIGVYNWFALTDAKDLNAGGIDYVDDDRIIYPFKEKFKFKDMISEVLSR